MAILASGISLSELRKQQAAFTEEIITELESNFRAPVKEADKYFSRPAAPAIAMEEEPPVRVNGKNMAVDFTFYGIAILLAGGVVMFNNTVPPEAADTLTQLAMIMERMDSLYSLGAQWAAMDTSI